MKKNISKSLLKRRINILYTEYEDLVMWAGAVPVDKETIYRTDHLYKRIQRLLKKIE